MQQATQEELEMINAHLKTSPDRVLDKPEMYVALTAVFSMHQCCCPCSLPSFSNLNPPPPSLRFLFELSQIVQFRERVWCFLFQTSFSDGLATLASKTDNIVKACKVRAQHGGHCHLITVPLYPSLLHHPIPFILLLPSSLSSPPPLFSSPPSVTVGVH